MKKSIWIIFGIILLIAIIMVVVYIRNKSLKTLGTIPIDTGVKPIGQRIPTQEEAREIVRMGDANGAPPVTPNPSTMVTPMLPSPAPAPAPMPAPPVPVRPGATQAPRPVISQPAPSPFVQVAAPRNSTPVFTVAPNVMPRASLTLPINLPPAVLRPGATSGRG